MPLLYLLLSLISLDFTTLEIKGNTSEQYRCSPCGRECDKTTYNTTGSCSSCKMPLVKASTVFFKNTKPDQICNYLKQHPETLVLDVRTKEEFEGKANPDFGTLKKAINISVQDLPSKISSIQQYKDKEILVYCSHGHRSEQASYLLNQAGFLKVTNMLGGMSVVTDANCKN